MRKGASHQQNCCQPIAVSANADVLVGKESRGGMPTQLPLSLCQSIFCWCAGFRSWSRGMSFGVMVAEAACRWMGEIDALDLSEGCRCILGERLF